MNATHPKILSVRDPDSATSTRPPIGGLRLVYRLRLSIPVGVSQTQTKTELSLCFWCLWTRQESNLRPPHCKSGALAN